MREIALLELLRAPDVYVEAGWDSLVELVHDAFAQGELRADLLLTAVVGERNTTVRESFDRLVTDLAAK